MKVQLSLGHPLLMFYTVCRFLPLGRQSAFASVRPGVPFGLGSWGPSCWLCMTSSLQL